MIVLLCLLLADPAVPALINKRCLGCHNNELNDGGISFQDPASLLKGGSRGPAVVPGRPEQSLLIEAVQRGGDLKMPPGRPLSKREISTLKAWIRRWPTATSDK